MLRELHISNLAVIADARVELASGLNCFTGATGAGKSLVIGAIELLLGLRSPAEMLRPGVDEGRVSGVFDVSHDLLLRIEKFVDAKLADDGGELLDQFGNLIALRQRYHGVYAQLQDAKQRLAELSANRTLREQQLELYRFQADEIDKAELSAGEYEELSARSAVLRNLEKLTKEATATHAALYAAEGSVLERLKMMSAVLAELSMLDQNVRSIADNMRDATIGLEEVAFDLSRYLDKLDLDPAEAAEVEDRLNLLNRVLNKHGRTVEDALAQRENLRSQSSDLERATDDVSSLDARIDPLTIELNMLGAQLSAKRQAAGRKLRPLIE